MKVFKTPKGTELPLLDLRGKDYLQVAHRLVWFREDKPEWSIETLLTEYQDSSLCKATIKNESGRIMATAHKYEDKKGFSDHREKCETGAIGRALALVGYGTQFAPEMDESERIVDSPVDRPKTTKSEKPQSHISDNQAKLLKAVNDRKAQWELYQVGEFIKKKFNVASAKDLNPTQLATTLSIIGSTTGSMALATLNSVQQEFDPDFDKDVK